MLQTVFEAGFTGDEAPSEDLIYGIGSGPLVGANRAGLVPQETRDEWSGR
jgi:hypothetical protein